MMVEAMLAGVLTNGMMIFAACSEMPSLFCSTFPSLPRALMSACEISESCRNVETLASNSACASICADGLRASACTRSVSCEPRSPSALASSRACSSSDRVNAMVWKNLSSALSSRKTPLTYALASGESKFVWRGMSSELGSMSPFRSTSIASATPFRAPRMPPVAISARLRSFVRTPVARLTSASNSAAGTSLAVSSARMPTLPVTLMRCVLGLVSRLARKNAATFSPVVDFCTSRPSRISVSISLSRAAL